MPDCVFKIADGERTMPMCFISITFVCH